MALETLDNQIDIRDINLDAPKEPHGRFDLANEVSSQQLEELLMLAVTNAHRMEYNLGGNELGPRSLAAMTILAPDKVEPRLVDGVWDKMKDFMQEIYAHKSSGPNYPQWARFMANIRVVFPQRFDELRHVDNEENFWDASREILADYHEDDDWLKWLLLASNLKLAFPNQAGKLRVDENAFVGAWQTLNQWKEWGDQPLPYLAQYIAAFRIIFPQRFGEFNIDESLWDMMRKQLRGPERDHDPINVLYLENVAAMQILAASSIAIDEAGLRLNVDYGTMATDTPAAMPTQRKF